MNILRTKTLPTSSGRTPGPITPGLRDCERRPPPCLREMTRRMGPGSRSLRSLGRDDELRLVARQTRPSSSGLTGRSSTSRRRCNGMGAVQTLPESSRRTPGPITPGFRDYERHLPPRLNETTRRMAPGSRSLRSLGRDDELRLVARQTRPSSSGLTGRSSTPQRRCDGMSAVQTLRESSRRTPGPITTGFDGYERHLPPRLKEATRRMGPGVRRDDKGGTLTPC